jgi:NAD(P)-dependent dehydrogenase (short-subunit alcohol dehydrogenase family)
MNLQNRVAIVTGASRGVGAATATALGLRGCSVVCAARATQASPLRIPGTIDDTVRTITDAGGRAIALPTNLAHDSETIAMVDGAIAEFGGVDILINNAAITFPGDLELEMKRFDLIMAVNLRAPLLTIQRVVPSMRERGGGAVINVSSLAALNAFPGLMAYGMAKAALERMTIDLAGQLRADKIAVNTFRIDVPVASEGFVANAPELDTADWEPPEVAAEGIVWMLEQPPSYTGHNAGMARLRTEHGIMSSRAERPYTQAAGLVTETWLRPNSAT